MKYLPHTKHAHILFLLITLILYSSLGLRVMKENNLCVGLEL